MKTYSTHGMELFYLMRSLSTDANHSNFTKPPSYLLFWHNYLLEAASLRHNKNSKKLKAGVCD